MIPPVVKEVVVPTTPTRAFEIFWSEIGAWWPLDSHAIALADGKKAVDIRFEPRISGAIEEIRDDGSRASWGTVTEWQPGFALAFTWQLNRPVQETTQVRLTFSPSEAGTRVTLTHSGWDARREDGPTARDGYDQGWDLVFRDRYGAACARTAAA